MAKRKRAETLDDLLRRHGVPVTEFAKRAGIPAFTLLRLRKGERVPRIATLTKLANALGLDPLRVAAAIEASRVAAQ